MNSTLLTLVEKLESCLAAQTNVIPWSSPVPSFGDISQSRVATLGLNPSNREFMDGSGAELRGAFRRFHTLKSLGLSRWSDAGDAHLELIIESCRAYFSRNPYDGWFRQLDFLISGIDVSYYPSLYQSSCCACHLDLIPYATACKWTGLTRAQQIALLEVASDTLGSLLKESPVEVLILNGRSVVKQFQDMTGTSLKEQEMLDWSLRRGARANVPGFSYKGYVKKIAGIDIEREILVLGYNHNIQSTFGVTNQVRSSIQKWIAKEAKGLLRETQRHYSRARA